MRDSRLLRCGSAGMSALATTGQKCIFPISHGPNAIRAARCAQAEEQRQPSFFSEKVSFRKKSVFLP
ncbi:hypothetical protein QW131_17400 [Roseibium salinum]|nr:hypothetical protein [Roseibium salinum]